MKERTRIDARFYICVFVNDAAHVCENRIKMINIHIHMCTLIMELNEPTLIRMTSASVRYLTLHIGDLISRDVKILPRHVRGNAGAFRQSSNFVLYLLGDLPQRSVRTVFLVSIGRLAIHCILFPDICAYI